MSFQKGRPLPALYVRKEPKDHGSQAPRRRRHARITAGHARVVVLEDVITTGGSTLKAVEKLGQAGVKVVGVVALVDRLEGGRRSDQGRWLTAGLDRHAARFHSRLTAWRVTHTGAKDCNSFTAGVASCTLTGC